MNLILPAIVNNSLNAGTLAENPVILMNNGGTRFMKKHCVKILKSAFLYFCILLFTALHTNAFAADLIVEYEFAGTLEDSFSNSSLTAFGPENDTKNCNNHTSGFLEDEEGTYWFWTSTLPRGGGFWIDVDQDISESYSIGGRFLLTKPVLPGKNYRLQKQCERQRFLFL